MVSWLWRAWPVGRIGLMFMSFTCRAELPHGAPPPSGEPLSVGILFGLKGARGLGMHLHPQRAHAVFVPHPRGPSKGSTRQAGTTVADCQVAHPERSGRVRCGAVASPASNILPNSEHNSNATRTLHMLFARKLGSPFDLKFGGGARPDPRSADRNER
jgi:hypothetical protein